MHNKVTGILLLLAVSLLIAAAPVEAIKTPSFESKVLELLKGAQTEVAQQQAQPQQQANAADAAAVAQSASLLSTSSSADLASSIAK